MQANPRDIASGTIFLAIGGFFAGYAYIKLNIGTAVRMGPGYFPIYLGAMLMLLGLAILVRAFLSAAEPLGAVSWRAVATIGAAPVAFALLVRPFGLAVALAALVAVAAFASRRMTPTYAVLLSVGLTALSLGIFKYGLGLNLAVFGTLIAPLIGTEG